MAELDRFMREAEVLQETSLSRSTMWAAIKKKKFPEPTPLTAGRVGWRKSEIARWQVSPAEWKPKGAA